MADIGTVERVASSQFVFAILFIFLLFGVAKVFLSYFKTVKDEAAQREKALINLYEQQRADSKSREENLMAHLDKTTKSLEGIEKNLTNLEQKMNAGLSDIWNHLEDSRKDDF